MVEVRSGSKVVCFGAVEWKLYLKRFSGFGALLRALARFDTLA